MAVGVGLHPERVAASGDEEQLSALVAWTRELAGGHSNRLVCIGEVGLDFRSSVLGGARSEDPVVAANKQRQRHVLRAMVALALELDLPLNVHSRSASKPTVDVLREAGATRVVLHAW